jgi:ethanolamine ammonia-lyase small subunit
MDQSKVDVEAIVQAVLSELRKQGNGAAAGNGQSQTTSNGGPVIDLPDPTLPEARRAIGVKNPHDPDGLRNLCATTTARIGVGRAGSRTQNRTLLLFQSDHGVTQDAIYGVVDEAVKDQFNLFSVKTMVSDRGEYLLRPDLGRRLSDEAKKTISERCTKKPQVQIVVGDG